MADFNSIHDRIKYLVATLEGGKNTAFALRLGISEANIRGYIKNVVPKANVLESIVTTYDVNAEWLLTGKGDILKTESSNASSAWDSFIDLIAEEVKRRM